MKRVDYLKEKLNIMWQLLFSHSYIVITDDDMASVCTEENVANMKDQIVLAGHKFDRMVEEHAARVVRD